MPPLRPARARSASARCRAPTLVTVGELDQPDMVDIAERLATDILQRHARAVGVAHLPPMERPAEFAQLLHQFLGT